MMPISSFLRSAVLLTDWRESISGPWQTLGLTLNALAGGLLDPVESDREGTLEGTGLARKAVWAATLELFRTAWPFQADAGHK